MILLFQLVDSGAHQSEAKVSIIRYPHCCFVWATQGLAHLPDVQIRSSEQSSPLEQEAPGKQISKCQSQSQRHILPAQCPDQEQEVALAHFPDLQTRSSEQSSPLEQEAPSQHVSQCYRSHHHKSSPTGAVSRPRTRATSRRRTSCSSG